MTKNIILFCILVLNFAYSCDGIYDGPWFGKAIYAFFIVPLIISILAFSIIKYRNNTLKKSLLVAISFFCLIVLGTLVISFSTNIRYGESVFVKCSEVLHEF